MKVLPHAGKDGIEDQSAGKLHKHCLLLVSKGRVELVFNKNRLFLVTSLLAKHNPPPPLPPLPSPQAMLHLLGRSALQRMKKVVHVTESTSSQECHRAAFAVDQCETWVMLGS